MTRKLPALAKVLLGRVGAEELAGDLDEELQAGRSALWYWRQIAGAIGHAVASSIRARPYLTFRAVAVGWIALQVVNGQLPFSPHPAVVAWITGLPSAPAVWAAQYALTGWVVERLHPRDRMTMVLTATLFLLVTNAVVAALTIWVISHWPHGATAPSVWWDLLRLPLPLFSVVGGVWAARNDRPLPQRTR